MMNKKRVVNEFMELVAISAATRSEHDLADVLKRKLIEIGLTVEEDATGEKIGGNAGNLIARLPGNINGTPSIMLNAHMDSVEPGSGIRPQLKDGVITSAGDTILGSDCKSGIVPILEALRQLREENLPHGEIVVLFTVAEEGGLHGAKNVDPEKIRTDFAYSMDGGGAPGGIVTMAPGQNQIEIAIYGKTAHAGLAPEEGINAIVLAGKALAEVPQGRIDFETTCNIGLIRGGGASNIVPDRVEILAEARSRNMDKLAKLTAEITGVFERIAAAGGGRSDIAVKKVYDPFVLTEKSPVIATAIEAVKSVGLELRLEGTGGGSDANFFNKYGIPCAVLSTGMAKVHTTEEFILEDHLYQTTALTLALIQHTAKLTK
jgi:tripeptide aminopeptidase